MTATLRPARLAATLLALCAPLGVLGPAATPDAHAARPAAPTLAPQDEEPEFTPPDPAGCSVCGDDPVRRKRADIVSHGGFRFGTSDTRIVQRLFRGIPLRWIEGEHVSLGFADVEYAFWFGGGDGLPTGGAGRDDDEGSGTALRELATGALALEPWHKTHVYLERAEAVYARMLDLLQVEQRDFPTLDAYGEPVQPAHKRGVYMGEGPHLGQAGKFELLLLPGAGQFDAYLADTRGLDGAETAVHLVPETDAVVLTMHQLDGDLWDDEKLHAYVAHMLTHMMFDSYRHYSYRSPDWLGVGLAHLFERELVRDANTFCGGHPTTADARDLRNWTTEARQLASRNRFTSVAQLVEREGVAEFTLTDHVTSWSMVRFLVTEHPDAFAAIANDLRGLSKGTQPVDAMVLRRAHRDAFARHLEWTYDEFDAAWRAWARKQRKAA